MAVALLKNLGVDPAIVDALIKSYGNNLEGLEISKDERDLKLILKNVDESENQPHVFVIHNFFTGLPSANQETQPVSPIETYKCRDIIEFFDEPHGEGENIRINGTLLKLGEVLYVLLHALAEAAQTAELGWVYIQDLKDQGIIATDGYQPFSRLRHALGGYLIRKNPQDLIESNGRKQYRISVDPRNIHFIKRDKK
jgi:hypothetical protein